MRMVTDPENWLTTAAVAQYELDRVVPVGVVLGRNAEDSGAVGYKAFKCL